MGGRRVSFPNCGTASAGVARQYCGALGKRANCQVAVSVHAATDDDLSLRRSAGQAVGQGSL
ncbi:transposase, partial [Streptomyces sp. 1222.5]|uniref:transposase n=1 Tax=Streptomyces sp. 1222.5 TaxID=1881026 RepID=UPI003EB94C6C